MANSELGRIEQIEGQQFTVALEDGRRVRFDAGEFRHLDHGYAVTSYSSQGETVECVPEEAATATSAAETLPALKWVRLKDTWINLDNVTFIEDAEYWLAVYFRLDYDAHLWQPAKQREHGERLILFGQEALCTGQKMILETA